ncbi:LOW QUALITY PROTEIN: sulfhydryl oxidase 1 [Pristis pectinata]|uniref:LOW QUALITY PROTEIN: sulfhydryl oxidase 1 n=1 Tax=Pristis pectinata TaxID=685728 RepID=UPI00223D2241|nr:LOW QUALITY PROTEIN: sulfhydryl oxidase 1 [Pristis pectinata]
MPVCSDMAWHWDTVLLTVAAISFLAKPAAVSGNGLYSYMDQVTLLDHDNFDRILYNSSKAWVVEFYAAWCGHCINFAPVWKSLANDIKEWQPALSLAVVHCANLKNRKLCQRFEIKSYPTIKLFKAFSKPSSKEEIYNGTELSVVALRHNFIDHLEKHGENEWPPACPPLEPISMAEVRSFFAANEVLYLALIFEDAKSYIGREVTLDMLQYENVAVRRVLKSEENLVKLFGVHKFPSCYLYFNDTTHREVTVKMETRIFYTYYLRRLPGVTRGASKLTPENSTYGFVTEPWKDFNSSKLYMSDLESAIYYSLKMEVGKHRELSGDTLMALKHFITVLTKFFPGRPFIMKLLQITDAWLTDVGTASVSYNALLDVLDNKNGTPGAMIPDKVNWVGCQGSRPYFRGYPCSIWTLFHLLTVQAAKYNKSMTDPLEVLSTLRQYVKHFFGCRSCANQSRSHAAASMDHVRSFNESILWLWSRHNRVNYRLAGARSEDPKFPKLQWPPPDMCVECHDEVNGRHMWITDAVLNFFYVHFSPDNIDYSYLEEEEALLKRQQKVREDTWQDQEKSGPEEDEKKDKGEDQGREEKEESTEPPVMKEEQVNPMIVRRIRSQKRTFVKWKRAAKMEVEDIVDLDSFVNEQYKKPALKDRAENKRTSLTNKRYHGPQLHLQSIDESEESREKLQNWVVGGWDQVNAKKKWIRLLGRSFSRTDTGLCILLYFLSALCLLSMYLYFKMKFRWRKWKYLFTSASVGVQYGREKN